MVTTPQPPPQEASKPPPPPVPNPSSPQPRILITPTEVEISLAPGFHYKMIRCINHFIDHLVKYHEDETSNISNSAVWYTRWKGIYPFIRSSKRTIQEVYQIYMNDYSESTKSVTTFELFMKIVEDVPKLRQCYDAKVKTNLFVDGNRFQLTIQLYTGQFKDDANPFNAADQGSLASDFEGFHDNRSITTWHTTSTKPSIAPSQSDVPTAINQPKSSDNMSVQSKLSHKDDDDDKKLPPNDSDDTNLSYSDTDPVSKAKYTRNQLQLKKDLTETCQQTINKEMKTVNNTLNQLMQQQLTIYQTIQKLPNLSPSTVLHSNKDRNPPTTTSGATPNPPTTPAQQHPRYSQPQFQRSGTLVFRYDNIDYELRDGQYTKADTTLRVVHDSNDLPLFYQELQSEAISYNILLEDFAALQAWVKYATNTLPTTCIMTSLNARDNTINAYNRMKNAIYTKLNKCTFQDPKHKAIVRHGSIGKDGFEILYELMTHCHPRLMVATIKVRSTNPRPQLDSDNSIYSYAEKLETWRTIETIEGLNHSDDQILNIVLEQLITDTRYELAVQSINSELTMRDMYARTTPGAHTPFPENLKLYNLPSTIMSYYSKEDKKLLFPAHETGPDSISSLTSTSVSTITESTTGLTDVIQAIIKLVSTPSNAQISALRQGTDGMCPGCGMFGHDVFTSGCDKCAQFVLIQRFLEKNPDQIKPLISKYRKHQGERAKQRRVRFQNKGTEGVEKDKVQDSTPNSRQKRGNRYNLRSKARVQQLCDAVNDILSTADENSTDEEFHNAVDSESEQSDTSAE